MCKRVLVLVFSCVCDEYSDKIDLNKKRSILGHSFKIPSTLVGELWQQGIEVVVPIVSTVMGHT